MTAEPPEPLSRALLNNDFAKAAFPVAAQRTNRPLVAVLGVLSFVAMSLAVLLPIALLVGLLWQGWHHRSVGQLLLGALTLLLLAALSRAFRAK